MSTMSTSMIMNTNIIMGMITSIITTMSIR